MAPMHPTAVLFRRRATALAAFLLAGGALLAGHTRAQAPPEGPDVAAALAAIRDEGLNRSRLADTLGYLTDVIGPRLTGSPGMKRANEWTRDRMASWGLANARLEPWGSFGRGWSLARFSAQVVEPQAIPLIAYPKAWSPGTPGAITREVVHLDARDEAGLEAYRGRLKGAIVLTSGAREVRVSFDPPARRRSAEELGRMEAGPGGGGRPAPPANTPAERARREFPAKRLAFLLREGAALQMEVTPFGDGGTLAVAAASVPQPAANGAGPAGAVRAWDRSAPRTLPQVVVAAEQYNRVVRMLRRGERLRMAVDLKVRFHEEDPLAYNTLAEIPGSDLAHELVMLGGHLDSWHAGTGATDNAAGVAVCMEAARLLQALRLRPRRTVRVVLWSGEEQGLLGSRAYVARHFRAPGENGAPGAVKPDHAALSAYYNLDVGTGKIRGIHTGLNRGVDPLFREWLAPFRDLGATTVSPTEQRGTDHNSFVAAGLPGFQFIQDPIEYFNRTHHTNLDVYDRALEEDLKQAAVIMAAFVYRTAMRSERLPRVNAVDP